MAKAQKRANTKASTKKAGSKKIAKPAKKAPSSKFVKNITLYKNQSDYF